MKKIILLALAWPLFTYKLYAQKEKLKDNREIIIIKNGDNQKKLTIETKDGNVFINGKPSSEYKGDDVTVIKQRFNSDSNFLYSPGANRRLLATRLHDNKAFLGVTTEKSDNGVKILKISKGSAAEKAGLKEGDIITKVGKNNINDPNELMEAVTAFKPKEAVTISYKRNGKSGDVKATLGESNFSRSFAFNNNMIGPRNFNFNMPEIARLPHEPFAMSWGFGRGRLGVRIEDTENDSGVKITEVHDESAAAKSGLKENDIITEVNGKKVKDVNEVRKELGDVKDKTSYNIKVKRNGSDMNFEIKIPKKSIRQICKNFSSVFINTGLPFQAAFSFISLKMVFIT
jgi:serine protease Do